MACGNFYIKFGVGNGVTYLFKSTACGKDSEGTGKNNLARRRQLKS
jgi:hypothetical protein